MHEIKLVFEDRYVGVNAPTKILHITDIFKYPIEMLVPAHCIGLKIYDGDAINDVLLHDLRFDGNDILNKDNQKVGKVGIS